MQQKHALIAGGSGLVGSTAAQTLQAQGWQVTTLSRRAPAGDSPYRHVKADLLDAASCQAAAAQVGHPTHLVYAAVNEVPGKRIESWASADYVDRNARMFDHLLALLPDEGRQLQQVLLVHGTKAYDPYGAKVLSVPLRESSPRPAKDDFYFRQEDRVAALAQQAGVPWTVLRAQIVTGGGLSSSNLNALLAVSVFAALRAEAGLDLPQPDIGDAVLEMTDVGLMGRAIAWALQAPAARHQVFNVTNGDVFTWRDLWPVIAETVGVRLGPVTPLSLQAELSSLGPAWTALVARHRLSAPADLMAFLGESGSLADAAMSGRRSVLASTVKIRQAGFHDCIDTVDSVVHWIRQWRADGLLPPRAQ